MRDEPREYRREDRESDDIEAERRRIARALEPSCSERSDTERRGHAESDLVPRAEVAIHKRPEGNARANPPRFR